MQTLLKDLSLACRQELVDLLEETTPVGTWDWDIVRNTFEWSRRQFAHFGLEPLPDGALTYEAWLRAIHPDDQERVQAVIADTIASGAPLDLTFRVLWREDDRSMPVDVHWLHSRGRLIRDANGSPLRMVGTSRDVTELEQRRAIERARADAELTTYFGGPSRFDLLFDSSPDCLAQFRVQSDGRFTYQAINPTGLKVVGMTMAAAHGLTPVDVLGPDDGGQVNEALAEVCSTGLPVHFYPTFNYSAKAVVYDATYMPVRNDQGVVTSIIIRARDITEEKRMEAALHQAQKMEALGTMAAGVAHDFNNLLTSLRGCFNRLERISRDVEVNHIVELGSRALRQGEALTRQLLTFARKQDFFVEPLSINECIEASVGVLRAAVPEARISLMLADPSLKVTADAGLVEACLMNLCINSRDARPKGCEVVISTELVEIACTCGGDVKAGTYVALSVADNGPGMSADLLARAIEPFFTTKAVGKGTGLGLSMVYGTVRTLGGAVRIDSVEGEGTNVSLLLPLA